MNLGPIKVRMYGGGEAGKGLGVKPKETEQTEVLQTEEKAGSTGHKR
jgi:hypothetical protein